MAIQCLDDPATILHKDWCLSVLSKDLTGALKVIDSKPHQCHTPPCVTLKTVHHLDLKAAPHAPCDSPAARSLNGQIVVNQLVTVFDQDGEHRGFHSGDFLWTGVGGLQVAGRMSGITNAGTHRAPPFSPCQNCNDRGVMEGRLCGQITSPNNPALNGCQVMAAYRIKFDPGTAGGTGAVSGTLEGVIICSCQN